LWQSDLKRLFSFSAIAHGGFFTLGFLAMNTEGAVAVLFSALTYPLMLLACFLVVCRTASNGKNLTLASFAGLHKRSPLLALTMAAGVFSLAGIPPFVGFIGKLALLTATVKSGHLLICVIAVLSSAVAVYYYLKIIQQSYFADSPNEETITLSLPEKITCSVLIILTLGLGIFPQPIFSLLHRAL